MANGNNNPAGFTKLSAVITNGSQYIVLSQGIVIAKPAFRVRAVKTGQYDQYSGYLVSNYPVFDIALRQSPNGILIRLANTEYNTGVAPTLNQVFEIEYGLKDRSNIYINGTSFSAADSSNSASKPLVLFAYSDALSNISRWGHRGYTNFIDIYDNDTPLFQLRPYQRDSDGAIGLYDFVNKQFHVSESNTPFGGITEKGEII